MILRASLSSRPQALVTLIERAMGKLVAREGADFLSGENENEFLDDTAEWSDDR